MNLEKINSVKNIIKKYVPCKLSARQINMHMAYTRGYTIGYLMRTGRIQELNELMKND